MPYALMPSNLADAVAALADDLRSPGVVKDIDSALLLIWNLRGIAVRLHGDSTPPPLVLPPSAAAPGDARATERKAEPQVDGGRLLADLIDRYQSDEHSPFQSLRFHTKANYSGLCRRIKNDRGDAWLRSLTGRDFIKWHEEWTAGGKHVAMAHSLIGMVRIVFGFGASILEDPDCERLSGALSKMRFKMAKPRYERLTLKQVNAIRAKAHAMGFPSIALAQAIQFETELRQRDVIGEWTPASAGAEAILSSEEYGNWARGICWNEIDENLVLRHSTSREQKPIEIDLRSARMVMEELDLQYGGGVPKTGPVIVYEYTKVPYRTFQFRRTWRLVAEAAGVPKHIKNMDSMRPSKDATAPSEDDAEDGVDLDLEFEPGQHGVTH